MKELVFALIAGSCVVSTAHAQGPYVGIAISSTDYNFGISGLSGMSYGLARDIDGDDYKQSVKFFGGYDLTPILGIEAGYTDLRRADAHYMIGPFHGHAWADGKHVYIAAKATAHLNEKFSLSGKLGAGYKKSTFIADSLGYNHWDSRTGVYAALGAEYNVTRQVALTLEYERYSKKMEFGARPVAISVGTRYNF